MARDSLVMLREREEWGLSSSDIVQSPERIAPGHAAGAPDVRRADEGAADEEAGEPSRGADDSEDGVGLGKWTADTAALGISARQASDAWRPEGCPHFAQSRAPGRRPQGVGLSFLGAHLRDDPPLGEGHSGAGSGGHFDESRWRGRCGGK